MPGSFVNTLAATLSTEWEYGVLYVAAATIISGVALNFINSRTDHEAAVSEERMLVATSTMTLFFVAVFVLARSGIGSVPMSPEAAFAARVSGSLVALFAAVINTAGRVALGRFWSNQIKIRRDHQLVRSWPYSWSRHPLYGSLVLFGIAMGLVSLNPFVIAATLLVFVPAMRYRSLHEERALVEAFGNEYRRYQRDVPMLLPHLPEPASRIARALLAAMQIWAAAYELLDVFLLSAMLTLGLSFLMQRDDFRLAYRFKPLVIVLCAGLAYLDSSFAIVLWIPALASVMSLTGQCPGTLLLRLAGWPRKEVSR